ncbi:cytochrome b/b6 domain-containing protein [Halomonas alkaliantarctica]|uniref:Cytochrome b/b6 domain-containing protein n=1 Tax=Halomonas alkaliantarctica TaxID=232346 RepID=A0ABY8LUB0_9GAMM|nr:cytochrome b/b6 domain-containing protein [Halomonas alkaliantarctica]WGI27039.1 cytochrome b/b6 domain-containing protein [Halomonas alkaliantarctica]
MTDNTRIYVWDPLIRLVHWALVAGVAVNLWLTEEGGDIHQWVGYSLVALIVVRILWGFIGPWSARWRSFWPTVSRLQCALRGRCSKTEQTGITHTPLGAIMMLVLLGLILGLGLTGYMMEETDRFWGVDWVEETHEFLANAILFLVPVHVLGAVVESIKQGDNLIASMLHGYRRRPTSNPNTKAHDVQS